MSALEELLELAKASGGTVVDSGDTVVTICTKSGAQMRLAKDPPTSEPAPRKRAITDLDRQRAARALRRLGVAVPDPKTRSGT